MSNNMKDAVFSLGAQLAYYNWHNYDSPEKNMNTILKKEDYHKRILQGKSSNFIAENTSYIEKIDGKDVTIYKENDKRLIMMYSEDKDEPNENPLFKELFTGWNFLEGANHHTIFKETNTGKVMKKVTKGSNGIYTSPIMAVESLTFNTLGISNKDSGFQAFAMKKGNDILISYRGTDFGKLSDLIDSDKEFRKDMNNNGVLAFFKDLPDQARCAIYFCQKIRKKYSGDIYVAGHSLGGALAQCVTAYMGDKVKRTVTWNALGIAKDDITLARYKNALRDKKMIHEMFLDKDNPESLIKKYELNEIDEQFQNPFGELFRYKVYKNFIKNMPKVNNVLNYYLLEDLIKSLKDMIGKSICVNNYEKSDNLNARDFLQSDLKFHGINNFLPFFHNNGHIMLETLRSNYISNAVKTCLINENSKLKEKLIVEYNTRTASPIYITANEFFSEISSENDRGITLGLNSQSFLLRDTLIANYKNTKEQNNYYIKDDNNEKYKYTLGKFNNCDILAGVKGKKVIKTTQKPLGVKSFSYIQLNGNQISKSQNA